MKQIYCFDLDTVFKNATEAERQTGVCRTSIVKACRGNRNTAGGMLWEYSNKKVCRVCV